MASPPKPRGLSIFGFPFRISPFFLLIMAFLGMPPGASEWNERVLGELAIWMIVVTISIGWHELGHAFAMRRYGYSPSIELYGMGGRTMWGKGPVPTPNQRIVVSLAGPFAGFGLGGLAFVVWLLLGDTSDRWALDWTFTLLLWANVAWGCLNLLPMLPWDGGHVLEGILDNVTDGKGRVPAGVVTIVVGLAAAAAGWFLLHSIWAVYLAGLSVLTGFRAVRARDEESAPRVETGALDPVEALARAREVIEAAGPSDRLVTAVLYGSSLPEWTALALDLEQRVAPLCATPDQRATALELAAWAHLLSGDAAAAERATVQMRPTHDPSPVLEATIALRQQRWEDALEAASELDPDEETLERGRIEAFAFGSLDRHDEAAAAIGDDRLGGSIVDAALFHAGRFEAAAALGAALFERFGNAEDAYNTACSEARAGRPLEGLRWLEKAVDAGYDDVAHLEEDTDLAAVRALDGYAPLRDRLQG